MKNGNEANEVLEKTKKMARYIQEIEELKKELALVREDAQVEYLRMDLRIKELEQINKKHQDLNGQLHIELTRLKGGL